MPAKSRWQFPAWSHRLDQRLQRDGRAGLRLPADRLARALSAPMASFTHPRCYSQRLSGVQLPTRKAENLFAPLFSNHQQQTRRSATRRNDEGQIAAEVRSVRQLTDTIGAFIDNWNDHPVPFTWNRGHVLTNH